MQNNGFTLIEVLIALVILAIALTAVIKSTSQNIRETMYIQNKTVANWVGTQVINEARIGILKIPMAPENLEEETNMLNQTWHWTGTEEKTPNPHILRIKVTVYKNHERLVGLESYLYVQQ